MIGQSILENVSNKIQQSKMDARYIIIFIVLATFDGIEFILKNIGTNGKIVMVAFHKNITAICF